MVPRFGQAGPLASLPLVWVVNGNRIYGMVTEAREDLTET